MVDKPLRWSSADVVAYVKKALKLGKVGHAGTLDPLATGLLILATWDATKKIPKLQELPKEYEVTAYLGAITLSYDAEFEPKEFKSTDHVTVKLILAVLEQFRGEILQKPPLYSAVKVKGKRAYELARKGIEVELPTRRVKIHDLEMRKWEPPHHLELRVVCSKGTYIRSLVHDIGQALGTGAYVLNLRRTRIGPFLVSEALSPKELVEMIKKGDEKGVVRLER